MKKVVFVQLCIQENKVEIFLNHAKNMVKKSNEETGCLKYKLLRDTYKDGEFFIYEEYQNQKAVENHNASKHFKDFLNLVMPFLTKEPVIETF